MSHTCKRCGKTIAVTHKDPVAVVAGGSYHVACLVKTGQEQRAAEEAEREARLSRREVRRVDGDA